jgi:hypothetical protein
MKMPSRPFYPVELPPDIFGLRPPSILGKACESKAETAQRIATVEKGVMDAFKAAVGHLGENEARLLFARVMRRPKRGPGKLLAPDRDARLLEEYDAAIQKGETVTALARRLRADGITLGNTEGAIATQIRKLVQERKKRKRATAFESRRWRMATRGEISLLSVATSKK